MWALVEMEDCVKLKRQRKHNASLTGGFIQMEYVDEACQRSRTLSPLQSQRDIAHTKCQNYMRIEDAGFPVPLALPVAQGR